MDLFRLGKGYWQRERTGLRGQRIILRQVSNSSAKAREICKKSVVQTNIRNANFAQKAGHLKCLKLKAKLHSFKSAQNLW